MFRITASVLVLCSVLTSALCCDWLSHYNDLRNSSLVLIDSMGGPFTTTSRLRIPDKLYKELMRREENFQLRFIRDSMEQIYNLYRHGNTSAAGWDTGKTNNFLESIKRQIVELDECVNSTHNEKTSKHYKVYEKRLKNYYQNLRKHTLGSVDDWEMIRKATKKNLIRLEMLGNRIKANRGQH